MTSGPGRPGGFGSNLTQHHPRGKMGARMTGSTIPLDRHRVSRTRRTWMSVRIVVRPGEPISSALRRLRGQLQAAGVTWEMRRRRCPADFTQERRAKRFQKRLKARRATLLAQLAGEQ